MKKKQSWIPFLLIAAMLCWCRTGMGEYARYETLFFDTFDTVVQIIGFAQDQETFNRIADEAETMFRRLHQVYDTYHEYENINNARKVNREAAIAPIPAEPELIELLLFARRMQPLTQGTVNIALGPVLSIWHAFREATETSANVEIPNTETLAAAAAHIDFDRVIIDEAACTVYFADPEIQLDMGSIAKGFATEMVAQWMLTTEMPSFVISAGGNVRTGNPPLDGRANWTIGIQAPESAEFLEKLTIANTSAVTSGDYHRYVMVDGERYHHIISPFTLMPANGMRSVTVVCEDSGLADLLSTAFFILPLDEGMSLADTLAVDALWLLADGRLEMTKGMSEIAASRH